MISKIRFLVILAFCASLASPLSAQGLGMGAVVRNNVFYLVDGNGTASVVKLPPAGQARWSPDGRRVAVTVKAAVQRGQAVSVDLAIVERGGRVVNKIPVIIRREDGTPTGALRFVEDLIWRDNDTICAEGSANPWVVELRCFAVMASSPSAYYVGMGFSVCAKSSLVAHYDFRFDELVPVALQVGGKTVATLPAVPFYHAVNPVWSDDCKVVSGVIGDAKGLEIWSVSIETGHVSRATVPAKGRFSLRGDLGPGYVFDSSARKLRRIPSKSEEKLAASRKAFQDRSQVGSVDWFPSTPEVPAP